jgi:hypothetical protein
MNPNGTSDIMHQILGVPADFYDFSELNLTNAPPLTLMTISCKNSTDSPARTHIAFAPNNSLT